MSVEGMDAELLEQLRADRAAQRRERRANNRDEVVAPAQRRSTARSAAPDLRDPAVRADLRADAAQQSRRIMEEQLALLERDIVERGFGDPDGGDFMRVPTASGQLSSSSAWEGVSGSVEPEFPAPWEEGSGDGGSGGGGSADAGPPPGVTAASWPASGEQAGHDDGGPPPGVTPAPWPAPGEQAGHDDGGPPPGVTPAPWPAPGEQAGHDDGGPPPGVTPAPWPAPGQDDEQAGHDAGHDQAGQDEAEHDEAPDQPELNEQADQPELDEAPQAEHDDQPELDDTDDEPEFEYDQPDQVGHPDHPDHGVPAIGPAGSLELLGQEPDGEELPEDGELEDQRRGGLGRPLRTGGPNPTAPASSLESLVSVQRAASRIADRAPLEDRLSSLLADLADLQTARDEDPNWDRATSAGSRTTASTTAEPSAAELAIASEAARVAEQLQNRRGGDVVRDLFGAMSPPPQPSRPASAAAQNRGWLLIKRSLNARAREALDEREAALTLANLPPGPPHGKTALRTVVRRVMVRLRVLRVMRDELAASRAELAASEAELDAQMAVKALRCPNCGIAHPNAYLVELYRICHFCLMVLRQPSALPMQAGVAAGQLVVAAAAYGHLSDAARAVEVSAVLQARVAQTGGGQLYVGAEEDCRAVFGGDPCPGEPKALRVRYQMNGRRGELLVPEVEGQEGRLVHDLSVWVPDEAPLLLVSEATYGHTRGLIHNRGSFDVTEHIQAMVDAAGGSYLEIGAHESLPALFGDPCPGMTKELVFRYEVLGRNGEVRHLESHGHLTEPLLLARVPTVAPLLLIDSAFYGRTEQEVEAREAEIQRNMVILNAMERQRVAGGTLVREQLQQLAKRAAMMREAEALAALLGTSVDVTDEMQRRVDHAGGGVLEVGADEDLNGLFGNPCPDLWKWLSITYETRGLDGTRMTPSEETTSHGHQRNYVAVTRQTHKVKATDRPPTLAAHLDEPVRLRCRKVLPALQIDRATFGHPGDLRKCFDVTTQVRLLADKHDCERLEIPTTLNVIDLFRDPCRGVRKMLTIRYSVRGMTGTLRVEERDGRPRATVRIGYPDDWRDVVSHKPSWRRAASDGWSQTTRSVLSSARSSEADAAPAVMDLTLAGVRARNEARKSSAGEQFLVKHRRSTVKLKSRTPSVVAPFQPHDPLGSVSSGSV